MAARYWVGGSATWDGTAGSKWSTTSGGASGAAAPTTSDDVFLDAASGAVTVTLASGAVCSTLDCTGFTGTLSHPSLVAMTVAGLLYKLVAGMTFTTTAAGSTARIDFTSTSGTCLITTAGKSMPSMTFNGAGGTWQFQDSVTTLTTHSVSLTRGTLNANGFNVSCGTFDSNNSNVRTLTMGSGTWTLTGTGAGNVWNIFTTTNLTFSGASATIVIGSVSANARVFDGGGKTFGTLTYTIAGSTGSLRIGGANTFGTINFSDVTNARNLILPGTLTTTIATTFNVNGTSGKLMSITSSGGGAAIISKSSGTVTCDFIDLSQSTATGGAIFYAGSHSVDSGGNSGWILSGGGRSNFFFF